MPYSISLRPRAIQIIDDVYDQREEYRAGSGMLFLEDLSSSLIQLEAFPFSGARVDVGLRRLVTIKTKFNVYYKVLNQTVEVLYLVHGSQDY